MRRNLDLTRGLVFSGQLFLDLAAAGMLREHAYKVVQGHAMRSWETGGDFRAAIESDAEVRQVPEDRSEVEGVPSASGDSCGNVDAIFEPRVWFRTPFYTVSFRCTRLTVRTRLLVPVLSIK